MWILIRLLFALGAFIHRWYRTPSESRKGSGLHVPGNGRTYFPITQNTKAGPQNIGVMVPLAFQCPFRLTKESFLDRIFKSFGLAHELQTNDLEFDRHVYLACDDERLRMLLMGSSEVRASILELFGKGVTRIVADGANLCIYGSASQEELGVIATRIAPLIAQQGSSLPARGGDPFVWKVLLVEAVIWSIAGYAAGAFTEFIVYSETVALNGGKLYTWGALTGLATAALLVMVVVLFLRRSSRSHRIIIESALVLGLSLPIFGVQATFDANRVLDRSSPEVLATVVTAKRLSIVRGRRTTSRYYYVYLRRLDGRSDRRLDNEIEIGSGLFASVEEGSRVTLRLRAGAFDVPWIDSIAETNPWSMSSTSENE